MILKSDDDNGFTLVEIVVTIIIVGVLASLALPRFSAVFERVRASEGAHILTALLRAQKAYRIEFGVYSTSTASLDVEIDRAENFVVTPNADPGIRVWNNANNVAQIRRSGGYLLTIDEDGAISCTDGPITCAEAGYN